MVENDKNSTTPYLIWVSPETPSELCSAARLNVTREMRRLGWQVSLIGTGPTGRCRFQGVEIHCVSRPKIYLLGMWIFHFYVFRFIAREWKSTDIILFHQKSAPWILPLRFFRTLIGTQRPLLVMDIRATSLLVPVTNWQNRLNVLFENIALHMANWWADGQTAITGRMAQAVQIPAQHLWGTWPSGVHLDQFTPAQTMRLWPLDGMPIHLIYVGALYQWRNLMALCRAVEAANREGMSFILSIVGDGRERSDLEAFARQTQGRIRVMTPVPHEQIQALLGQAHVGVLPFPDQEYFRVSSPIKLFEYMAAGLPILATRIACHTDVVGEGEFVFWAEGDSVEDLSVALRQVWQASASLSRMGSEAASCAQAWTWEESAKKLSNALQQGLAGRCIAPGRVILE